MLKPKAKSQKLKVKKGFTLVEMLVSLTIFATVVTIAIGVFTTVLKGQRHALAMQAVYGNTSVLIESMIREMRTSESFSIPGNCLASSLAFDPAGSVRGTGITFINAKGQSVTYRLNGSKLERSTSGGNCGSGSFQQISSLGVQITNFNFVLQGNSPPPDTNQPMITVIGRFQGVGIRPEEQVAIDFSTSVTQRHLDD